MEHRTVEIYSCEHCGREFLSREECESHEKTHIESFDVASPKEVAEKLMYLKDIAYGYRFGNEVLGMPLQSFYNLMDKAAKFVLEEREK